MRVWALWSSRVYLYSASDLIDVFTTEELAETVKANLIGKPVDPRRSRAFDAWPTTWEDDEDFPDLCVRPLDLR